MTYPEAECVVDGEVLRGLEHAAAWGRVPINNVVPAAGAS
jgi:hypothetical protein